MSSLAEWLAPGAILAVLGLTIGHWRWTVGVLREIKDAQVKFDSALRGYDGQGGALHDIEHLKRESATVDERIKQSRHDARGAIQKEVMRLEMGIHEQFATFQKHLDQRFHDLGVGRPKSGG